jgi:hypothetical protein
VQPSNDSLSNSETNEVTQTVYRNSLGKFTFILPQGWKSEPLAAAVGGVIQQNESNAAFTSSDSPTKILLTIQSNTGDYSSAEAYVNALLVKNRADVKRGDEPYEWEYKSLGKFSSATLDGYIVDRLMTPAGYVSHIYILHQNTILDFMVHHENDQQVFDVDNADIQTSSGIINSLQWTT